MPTPAQKAAATRKLNRDNARVERGVEYRAGWMDSNSQPVAAPAIVAELAAVEAAKPPALALPTVHMNGTSARSLSDENQAAYHAISAAVDKLCDAAPNARDYYVQADGDAYLKARAQHCARIDKLRGVMEELEKIMEHVNSDPRAAR